jgi:hypothetical protein
MSLPSVLIEQLPFVAVFILFTAFIVTVGLKAEKEGRQEYVAAMSEARTQYIAALSADRKEFIETIRMLTSEIHNLTAEVTRQGAIR